MLNEKIYDIQIRPAEAEDSKKYYINDYVELLKQLESLKHEANAMAHDIYREPIFFKDYNCLSITLKILENRLKNLLKWKSLLEKDGINSKKLVLKEIEKEIEEIKKW